ncbi:MAG: calcium-binding protein [Planctomycetia bacterium]|nr:calcium-binding protein [Planctomycetia bacterium]
MTFNEIVTGVTTSNFVLDKTGLSAASIANVTGSGTTYTVTTNTGTADGTLSVDFLASGHNVLDSVSNISVANFTAGETYVVDHTPPVVTLIVRANPNPTNINSVNFTVTFSEPVTGVGMNDFVLHQTLLTSAAITGISGSGTTYTVTANTGTGEGTMWIDFDTTAGGGVFDAALNTSEVSFTTGQVYALDKLKPMVTSITRLDSSPTNAASLHFLVTFNEIVTGVTTNNFVLDTSGLSGAAITNLTGSGTTYTVTLSTGVSDGTLSIDFNAAGHNVLDSVNNISAVNFTPGEAYRVDTVPPIPTIQSIPDVQRVAVGPIAVTFNEPVTGVDISDFVLTRTPVGSGTPTTLTLTAGMLTGSGSLYSLNPISVTGIEGTYRLTLKSSGTGIIDFVGNASGGTSELWQFVSTQVVVTGTGNNKTLTITDNGGPSGASNSDDGITLSFVPGAPNMVRVSYEAAPGFAGVYEDIPVTGLANVVINTSTGNDTVTIDARNGGLPFVITFNGGVGGNDTLHVINFDSSFNAFTANYSNVNDGSIQLKSNGVTTTTISYTGLEPITIDGTPTEAIFNLPSTNDTDVVLSAMNANTFLLTGSTFEATAFSIGTLGSLTINSNSGNDKVTVASLPANFAGSLTVNGGDGNDTLEATSSQRAVTLLGGKGNDSLTGGGSDDSLSGGDGNDTLKAGAGNDTLSGGLGDDLLNGEGGIDLHAATVTSNVTITNTKVIGGGIGADTLLNLENVDFSGDSKNNLLDASQYTLGAVALHGLDGNDTLLGGTRSDLIDGGNGIDQINQTSVFTQTLSGAQLTGNGSDTLMSIERAILTAVSALGNTIDASAFNGLVTLNGGNGPDRLLSSIAGGVINGGSGKDTIIGGIGAERISGGADNDSITGGGGNDTIVGDSGNDTLDGGIGADVISGSDGRDMIFGGDGNDTIDGGTADDTISGDKGYDSIIGGIGNDAISGGDGNDYLDGQGGNDTLLGDAGSDTLRGGAGRDVCLGGDGADDIDGGADSDTVSGIRGVDLISTPSEIDNAFIFDFHKLLA